MVPVCAGLRCPRYQLPSGAWYERYTTLSNPRTGAPLGIAPALFSTALLIHAGCNVSRKAGLVATLLSAQNPGSGSFCNVAGSHWSSDRVVGLPSQYTRIESPCLNVCRLP